MIDLFSCYVPGWLIAERDSAALAERLVVETIATHHVARDQLTILADRDTSMASKPVAMLLADLGVAKSHSRPHHSNDNPYSESVVQDPQLPARRSRPVPLNPAPTIVLPGVPPLGTTGGFGGVRAARSCSARPFG